MTIHVTTDSFISDVQQQFQRSFPGLKLEFFFTANDKVIPSTHLHHSFPFVRIKELNQLSRKRQLDITGEMTICEVEKKFRRKFGLPARIYKKVGDYWLKKASMDRCQLGTPIDFNGVYYIHVSAKRIQPDFSI